METQNKQFTHTNTHNTQIHQTKTTQMASWHKQGYIRPLIYILCEQACIPETKRANIHIWYKVPLWALGQYLEKINHFKHDLTNKPTRAHQYDISPESTRAGLLDRHNFVRDRGFLTLCELHKSEASTQETVNTTFPPWTTTIPDEKIYHNATRRRTHVPE